MGLGTLFCFCTPLLRVGRFPVFLLRLCAVFGGLLCFLVLFLACSCPSGFFLLSVGVVVLSVLSGAVGSCLFGVALLLRLRFRWLMLGLCVVSSGASFLPALPLLPSGGWGLFFSAVLVASGLSLFPLSSWVAVWLPSLGALPVNPYLLKGELSWVNSMKWP